MEGRRQAEEMSRAANRFAEAVRELTVTMDRFMEYQQQLWQRYEHQSPLRETGEYQARAGLSEEEAINIARQEVSEVRRLSDPRRPEMLPPPDAEEIEEWERRREERRREGNK